jgi:hypothetical protein
VQPTDGAANGLIPYLVMESIEGESLLDVIERDGPLEFKRSLKDLHRTP